jgi:hypothetical protein
MSFSAEDIRTTELQNVTYEPLVVLLSDEKTEVLFEPQAIKVLPESEAFRALSRYNMNGRTLLKLSINSDPKYTDELFDPNKRFKQPKVTYTCDICGKVCATKFALSGHMRSHVKDFPAPTETK